MNPEPILQEIEKKFSRKCPSRCPFCGGCYSEDRCVMCARTTEILREVRVMREQRKKHHNWHGSYGHWINTGGIRGSRRYGAK